METQTSCYFARDIKKSVKQEIHYTSPRREVISLDRIRSSEIPRRTWRRVSQDDLIRNEEPLTEEKKEFIGSLYDESE
ncbi:hypothetical protein RRG08_000401 [Elysia crispata]|uniref:Uncharacterized protein n=1 Tax=Elysia crispata TaxID=231223 RepID=A0AAE0ZUC6_9GAST|nr:hypothetical protein RRG08_000401 [Elysia crispata]